jgi:phosphohistidine phosphatase
MKLYLVQHAEARPKEEDPKQGLTNKGLVDIKKVADFVARRARVRVAVIYHSGKHRARETAEALADYLHPVKGVREGDCLVPMDEPDFWVKRALELKDDTMLVGHLPHLDKLASALLTGSEEGGVVTFHKAGIVCLERDENNRWSLAWAVTPNILE